MTLVLPLQLFPQAGSGSLRGGGRMGVRIGTHTLDQGGGTECLGPREAEMMFGARGRGAGPAEGMLGSFSFLKPVTCSVPSE